MKHPYSEPNFDKAEILWHARERLKLNMVPDETGKPIPLLTFMHKLNRKGMLTLQAYISPFRTVYQIGKREVTKQVFEDAVKVVESWKYEGRCAPLDWGTRYEWKKDFSEGKLIFTISDKGVEVGRND